MSQVLRPASVEDLPLLVDLLISCQLPSQGVVENLDGFVVAFDGEKLIGCGGIEVYGSSALLRSVAVAETHRKAGLGQQIVWALIDGAAARNITKVILLTTSAKGFFERFGFQEIERSQVPAPVLSSVEFQGVCPTTAPVLSIDIALPPQDKGLLLQ
jgi:amino-acid N-acetyltransferase